MFRNALAALCGVALLALSGCASMSAEECEFSDWYAVGFEDGTRGRTADAIGGRRKACARHGFGVDFDSYQAGRDAGLVDFCQPQRGFDVGSAGQRYRGVCPADLEAGFLEAYRVGSHLHQLRSALNSSQSRIRSAENELADLQRAIADAEALLIAQETTVDERVRLLAELKQHNQRVGELEAHIDQLIATSAANEQALRQYEFDLASLGY